MSTFAKGTTVSVSKSKAEIEHMLSRYGVKGFTSGWVEQRAAIMFEANGRRVRFTLNLPTIEEFEKAQKNKRSASAMQVACDAEHRRLWRALALVIKAKLESVESEIETFENAFLSNIVIPKTGETLGEWATPVLLQAYTKAADMPKILGA